MQTLHVKGYDMAYLEVAYAGPARGEERQTLRASARPPSRNP
jgi:hypothetical protein